MGECVLGLVAQEEKHEDSRVVYVTLKASR